MIAKSALIASIATVGIASSANAQTWNETLNGGGDAGTLLPSAQQTVGVGPLVSITGALSVTGDLDMYCIEINDEAAFLATFVASSASQDYQFFLFNPAGVGVVFNDDDPTGGLDPRLTSANVTANGEYYLAVGRFDTDALNLAGGTQAANGIWHDGTPYTGQYAPDGPGSSNPVLAGWAFSTSTVTGNYTITLAGVTYCQVPAPGAVALLGLAGLVGTRRRRS